ncbi:MAG: hypothetical protein ACFFBP_13045 [Promethearchaeota archaeon]
MVCVGFWALYWQIMIKFMVETSHFDFGIYYYSGRQIWSNPRRFYEEDYGYSIGIAYLPFFLVLWAISLSLLPYNISYFIWYIFIYLFAFLFILEFNKILTLLEVKERNYRFLFLIIISNGWLVLHQFALSQSKFLVGLILFYIIRRELQYKKMDLEKSIKYYWWTYFLFILIVGMVPYFMILLLIYIFHDIHKEELFAKLNLKKYGIVIVMILAQNFLFFLHPILIFDFLRIWRRYQERQFELKHFYLLFINDVFSISDVIKFAVSLTLLIIMYIVAVILIITKKIRLIDKFSYFAVSFLFLNYLAYRVLVILLPLTLLLFIPFLKQDVKGNEFIKKNKIVLLGFLSVSGIYLVVERVNPYYPYFEGMVAGYLICTCILGICLLIFCKYKQSNIKEEN